MPKKTHIQTEIETAAAFYRACVQLDEVARPGGGQDLQREAYKAAVALQRTLDAEIAAWNDEEDKTEFPRLALCAGADSWAMWANRDKCEIYMVEAMASDDAEYGRGLCPSCLPLKIAWDKDEAHL